jgi:hypothetical protein
MFEDILNYDRDRAKAVEKLKEPDEMTRPICGVIGLHVCGSGLIQNPPYSGGKSSGPSISPGQPSTPGKAPVKRSTRGKLFGKSSKTKP